MRSMFAAAAVLCGLTASFPTHADLDALVVSALGPVDGRAVISTPDGRMHVVHTGDTVPGMGAVVRQILSDRLVLEIPADQSSPAVTVWVYRARDGESRVRRFSANPPADEQPATASVIVVDDDAAGSVSE